MGFGILGGLGGVGVGVEKDTDSHHFVFCPRVLEAMGGPRGAAGRGAK